MSSSIVISFIIVASSLFGTDPLGRPHNDVMHSRYHGEKGAVEMVYTVSIQHLLIHTMFHCRVYETQQDIAVFRSSWIHEVLQHSCTIHDIPLGQHLLLPHYLAPVTPPHPSTSIHTTKHESLTSAGNKWKNSRESHQQGNKLCPSVDDGVARRPANGGVYSLSESATTMFVEYNATWEKLESSMRSTDLKGMFEFTLPMKSLPTHLIMSSSVVLEMKLFCLCADIADTVQVPRVANAALIDFVSSQPEFKIRRI